jgi:hypothetical protein
MATDPLPSTAESRLLERIRRRRWLLALTLFVGLCLVAYLALKVVPEWLANTHKLTPDQARAEVGRVRTAVLATLAGAIAVTGSVIAGLTYRLNRELAVQAEERDRRSHELDRQGQLTERFTRAIDQLGNRDSLDVRLGGIYALERIARDSADDHPQVMEVLTAFIRDHAPWPPSAPSSEQFTPADVTASGRIVEERPETDVQAILTVLGRRNRAHDPEGRRALDLRATDLRGASLSGLHLGNADLSGAHLEGAWLFVAHLEGARLYRVTLTSAWLNNVHLERADLANAQLPSANLLSAHLEHATLRGADLKAANLTGAHLNEADLQGANLEHAQVDGAVFRAAVIDEDTIPPTPDFDWSLHEVVRADERGATSVGHN